MTNNATPIFRTIDHFTRTRSGVDGNCVTEAGGGDFLQLPVDHFQSSRKWWLLILYFEREGSRCQAIGCNGKKG